MLLKPLSLAAAGLAVATQAFLIPPEISKSDIDVVDSLTAGVEAFSVPQSAVVNVSCPGCLSHGNEGHHGAQAASDKPSHLELAFSIDHTEPADRLIVNDFPLYPKANPFLYTLKAPLVPDGCMRSAVKELRGHRPRPFPQQELGYQLSVSQRATNAEDGLALYDLALQIIEVGDVFVDGVPTVQITLIKDVNTGALAIGGVTKSETAAPTPGDKEEECTTFMCKWLAAMKAGMAKVKGCHGKMRGGAKDSRPHHHHGGHHHHKGHPNAEGGDRHHRISHHHTWSQLFKNVVQHIILPIAVGIVAGVIVSLIGMMVGSLVVTVWRTFFRRPSHRHHSHSHSHSHAHSKAPAEEAADADVEEKSGLIEHQDPPPSYDEESIGTPPSYEGEAAPKTDV